MALIIGTSGNDALPGTADDDTLDGGAGIDTLEGGGGNDSYVVDNASDLVIELSAAGRDAVRSTVSYTLPDHVEMLMLLGANPINGTGNAADNILSGNSASNTLNGAGGADIMAGGDGNDIYVVDHVNDQVLELSNSGVDFVQSSVSFDLMQAWHVENLTLTGADAISGSGNWLDNVLNGNAAGNTLYGDRGNDTLDGGAGADTMRGGSGDDVYKIDNVGDVVVERSGEGSDVIFSSVSYTLPEHVENLALTGFAAISGIGNAGNNFIYGSRNSNYLQGGAGDDYLTTNSEEFTFGAVDTLDGGAGDDTLIGGVVQDIIIWDEADSLIDGGLGDADTLLVDGAGVFLDLTAIPDSRISEIEVIDITGSGNNVLKLGYGDVLAISSSTNILRIDGDVGDTVLAVGTWAQGADQSLDSVLYRAYTQGGGTVATLLLDSEITFSLI